MSVTQLAVVGADLAVAAGLGWWFFGPKPTAEAAEAGGVQEVRVTVRGGYIPNRIRARAGVPLRLVFDRQESGDCTSRVVFPDFGVSAELPAFGRASVEVTPPAAGEYGFACGMNMIHGTLVVEDQAAAADGGRPVGAAVRSAPGEEGEDRVPVGVAAEVAGVGHEATVIVDGGYQPATVQAHGGHEFTCGMGMLHGAVENTEAGTIAETSRALSTRRQSGTRHDRPPVVPPVVLDSAARPEPDGLDGEAGERRAEMRDLSRRVLVGAILTLPVLFGGLAWDFFHPAWLPHLFRNEPPAWFAFALVTPVMA